MNITICGGGNLAHALAAYLSIKKDVEISVLTRNPNKWEKQLKCKLPDSSIFTSKPIFVTNNAESVIPNADIIIIAAPNFAIEDILNTIKDYYNPNTWIGSILCSGGFFWQSYKILGKLNYTFGFQRVPFICRTIDYGSLVHISGLKNSMEIFVSENDKTKSFKVLLESFFNTKINFLDNYLEATISNSNPILHPSRLYYLFENYNHNIGLEKDSLFYEEWTNESSSLLINCDKELHRIISKIPIKIKLKAITEHYEVSNAEELTNKIQSIPAFKKLRSPLIHKNNKFFADVNNRYFQEDIPYGLLIIKSLGLLSETETPHIDKILNWAEDFMDIKLIEENKLLSSTLKYSLPQNFGAKKINDIVNIF